MRAEKAKKLRAKIEKDNPTPAPKTPKLLPETIRTLQRLNNVLVISDTHVGSKLAILHGPVTTDEGGKYHPSPLQKQLFHFWQHIFHEWLPEATRGEPFAVIHNGDVIDGSHHGTTTVITNNLHDQCLFAYELLKPVVAQCNGMFFMVRGTEAHSGKSAQEEENLARQLNAIPNEFGRHCRYDLWLRLGQKFLVHAMHHIGTTGSNAYEATAIHKEVTESLTEAARWGYEPPDVVVRCLHPNCQILTELGWISQEQAKPGILALTLNLGTQQLEWQPILNVTTQPKNQDPELVTIHDKNQPNNIVTITTTDHTILVRRIGEQEIKTIQAIELLNPNHQLLNHEIVTTPSQSATSHPNKTWLNHRAKTIGAILASTPAPNKTGNPNAICIQIEKAPESTRQILKTIHATFHQNTATIHPDDSPEAHWITQHIQQTTTGQHLHPLLLNEWLRDGHDNHWLYDLLQGISAQPNCNNLITFSTPKHQTLINQLQMLAITTRSTIRFEKTPATTRKQRIIIHWHRKQKGLAIHQHVKARLVQNHQNTWCVQTPNGTIVARYHHNNHTPSTPIILGNSHRHRHAETSIPTAKGRAIGTVTPGWQDKTPFVWKLPGGRLAPAQFGAILIRAAHGRIFVDPKVWTAPRSFIANDPTHEDQP